MGSNPQVGLTPHSHRTFRPVPTMKLLGIMLRNRCWPNHLSRCYSRRCRRMVLESVGVIIPSTYTSRPGIFINRFQCMVDGWMDGCVGWKIVGLSWCVYVNSSIVCEGALVNTNPQSSLTPRQVEVKFPQNCFRFTILFSFFLFETEGRQANPKHRRQLTTWQVFRQVERRFHGWDSNRQPLP